MQLSQNSPNQLIQAEHWGQLLYFGLQTGGAAYILSLALAQPVQFCIKQSMAHGTELLGSTAIALLTAWAVFGLLCAVPIVWAVKRRIDGLLDRRDGFRQDNLQHVLLCRKAAVFSLVAGPIWWLAPALLSMR
jgi:hypothetical protein